MGHKIIELTRGWLKNLSVKNNVLSTAWYVYYKFLDFDKAVGVVKLNFYQLNGREIYKLDKATKKGE